MKTARGREEDETMVMFTYALKQASDGTFAWAARGSENLNTTHDRYPDMLLLGWGPDEKASLLAAARAWIVERGIFADVVIPR